MRRYIDSVKKLFEIAKGKRFVVIQMFISCGLYNLCTLLPPVATSGIIAVISDGNFKGIWVYVLMYIVFYVMYFFFSFGYSGGLTVMVNENGQPLIWKGESND